MTTTTPTKADGAPRLSLLFDMASPAWATPASEIYSAAIELTSRADAMGFVQVILHEHHNTDDGYLSSPMVLAAAMAARTSHMRLVLSAVIAPLRHPVHLAEDLAALDLLSEGRLSVVLAAGNRASEFALFGASLRHRPSLMEETVATLRAAWTGEPFEFRGAPALVLPRPYRDGGPPLWLGGMAEPSALRAARLGTGYQPASPALYRTYLGELERLGAEQPISPEHAVVPISGSTDRRSPAFLHISNEPDADWERIAPHALHHVNTYARWAAAEGEGWAPPLVADADELRQGGEYLVVTPDECVELFTAVGASGGVGFRPLIGGLDPSMAHASFDLLERDVLPRLGQSASPDTNDNEPDRSSR